MGFSGAGWGRYYILLTICGEVFKRRVTRQVEGQGRL
jgi:hypothetical protein